MANIVLCMIVKDEAHVMERCLTHALQFIDAACICDTGSMDGTPEVIERVLDATDIPFRVCRHEWVDFGTNRTQSYAEARNLARELGWEFNQSYAYVLDADMILRAGANFDRSQLDADGYKLQVRHGSLVFSFLFMLKLAHDWRCIGAAHEYWSADDAQDIELLDSLSVDHVGDGGVSDDKLEHYRRLLEADLEKNPDNARTVFYLAQSYFDLRRYDDAREFYQRRAVMGDWQEEAWYARYRAAMCIAELDGWEQAAGELLSVWESSPQRAEPLFTLAYYARQQKAAHAAMLAAERALQIPFPEGDQLFVDQRAYREGPIEEISISAYYTGQHARGMAACDALMHHRATAPSVRNLASSNSVHYTEPLAQPEAARRVNIPSELLGTIFAPSTGSIHPTATGYALVNRLVSYYQHTGATFTPRDPDGKIYSRNAWVDLDRDLKPRRATLIDDALFEQMVMVPAAQAQVCGLEDLRLVRWNDAWWFTAGSFQTDLLQRSRLVLGRLSQNGLTVEHIVPLVYDAGSKVEKNWAPFIQDGRLLLLHGSDPVVILEPDPETGKCEVVSRALPPVDMQRYRGSSQLVRVGERYLAVVHEVAPADEGRYYLHRFIEMDDAHRITRASRRFIFLHRGVEYCCGMCLSHAGDELIISFSWEDRESWLLQLPRADVETRLIPIEELAFLDPPADAEAVGPGWLDLTDWTDAQSAPYGGRVKGFGDSAAPSTPPQTRWWSRRRRRLPGSD